MGLIAQELFLEWNGRRLWRAADIFVCATAVLGKKKKKRSWIRMFRVVFLDFFFPWSQSFLLDNWYCIKLKLRSVVHNTEEKAWWHYSQQRSSFSLEMCLLRLTVDELWWVGFYRQAIRVSSLHFKIPVMKGKIHD